MNETTNSTGWNSNDNQIWDSIPNADAHGAGQVQS